MAPRMLKSLVAQSSVGLYVTLICTLTGTIAACCIERNSQCAHRKCVYILSTSRRQIYVKMKLTVLRRIYDPMNGLNNCIRN